MYSALRMCVCFGLSAFLVIWLELKSLGPYFFLSAGEQIYFRETVCFYSLRSLSEQNEISLMSLGILQKSVNFQKVYAEYYSNRSY